VVAAVVVGTNIREHIKLKQVAPAGIPGDGERRSTWQDQSSTPRSDRKSSPGKRSRSRSACSNRPARMPAPRPPPPPSRTMPPNPHSRRPKSGLVKGGAKLWRKGRGTMWLSIPKILDDITPGSSVRIRAPAYARATTGKRAKIWYSWRNVAHAGMKRGQVAPRDAPHLPAPMRQRGRTPVRGSSVRAATKRNQTLGCVGPSQRPVRQLIKVLFQDRGLLHRVLAALFQWAAKGRKRLAEPSM